MNELIKTTTAIATCKQAEVVPQLMVMFRAVTPQFYKGMSDDDIKAEKLSIELLTSNIEQPCLAKMCELAVLNYPKTRSENPKTYFDINYVLTFYKQAFNKVFCEDVELPKGSEYISGHYDECLHIITEKYKTSTGEIVELREIKDAPKNSFGRVYTSKALNRCFTDFEDIEI